MLSDPKGSFPQLSVLSLILNAKSRHRPFEITDRRAGETFFRNKYSKQIFLQWEEDNWFIMKKGMRWENGRHYPAQLNMQSVSVERIFENNIVFFTPIMGNSGFAINNDLWCRLLVAEQLQLMQHKDYMHFIIYAPLHFPRTLESSTLRTSLPPEGLSWETMIYCLCC